MNAKILVACHKPCWTPKGKTYLPIQVGACGKEAFLSVTDAAGDNISAKNGSFCELTALYWAWKNLDCDVIGLTHYRRYFCRPFPIKHVLFPDEQYLSKVMRENTVILPRRANFGGLSVGEAYKSSHVAADLDTVAGIIEQRFPGFRADFEQVMAAHECYLLNMFIMSKVRFDSYCEWIFSVLFELERRIDLSAHVGEQKRVFGYMSERLFNVWLLHHREELSLMEMDVVYTENRGWQHILSQFLRRALN